MRYFEIASGLRLTISSEEQALLDLADPELVRDDLDERQQETARLMVSRGALKQKMKNGEIVYQANSDKDIWRDR